MVEYHVKQKDLLDVRTRSSVVVGISALFTVLHRDGRLRTYPWNDTTTTNRVAQFQPTNPMPDDGIVVGLNVEVPLGIERGQVYAEAFITDGATGLARTWLGKGYVYDQHFVGLGEFEESGPGGGEGHLNWRVIADDIAPAASTIRLLAVANGFRRIHGFVWYYHSSSDVATRILRVFVRAPGPSLPTGFSIPEIVNLPHSDNLTLTANEEGILYSSAKMASRNDATTMSTENAATQPQIWPVDMEEDDLMELFFSVTDGESADRNSIFILQEEWIKG